MVGAPLAFGLHRLGNERGREPPVHLPTVKFAATQDVSLRQGLGGPWQPASHRQFDMNGDTNLARVLDAACTPHTADCQTVSDCTVLADIAQSSIDCNAYAALGTSVHTEVTHSDQGNPGQNGAPYSIVSNHWIRTCSSRPSAAASHG